MNGTTLTAFDPLAFLAQAGLGRRIVRLRADEHFFTQGTPADCVFYLQSGRAKLTVVSTNGKEATITLLVAGEFQGRFDEGSSDSEAEATATGVCVALKIEREEMVRVLHEEHTFSDLFLRFLLIRSIAIRPFFPDWWDSSPRDRRVSGPLRFPGSPRDRRVSGLLPLPA